MLRSGFRKSLYLNWRRTPLRTRKAWNVTDAEITQRDIQHERTTKTKHNQNKNREFLSEINQYRGLHKRKAPYLLPYWTEMTFVPVCVYLNTALRSSFIYNIIINTESLPWAPYAPAPTARAPLRAANLCTPKDRLIPPLSSRTSSDPQPDATASCTRLHDTVPARRLNSQFHPNESWLNSEWILSEP